MKAAEKAKRMAQIYANNSIAWRGDLIKCPVCEIDFVKKTKCQSFCKTKDKTCKDDFFKEISGNPEMEGGVKHSAIDKVSN